MSILNSMHYEAKYSGFIRIQLLLQFGLEYGRNSLCNIMFIYIYVSSDFYFVCSCNHLRLISVVVCSVGHWQHLGQKTTTDRQQLGQQCGAHKKSQTMHSHTRWGLRPCHPQHPWLSATVLWSFSALVGGEPHYLRLSRAQSQLR